MNRTGAMAPGPGCAAGRSGDAFTKIVEVLERGRGPRGDRSVASKRRIAIVVREASWVQTKRLKYWVGRLSRAEAPARPVALVPATIVGAELSAIIRVGDVMIELSSATPEQVAQVAQAIARSTS